MMEVGDDNLILTLAPPRVPETATVLLGGGVNFADLPEYAQIEFQVRKRK